MEHRIPSNTETYKHIQENIKKFNLPNNQTIINWGDPNDGDCDGTAYDIIYWYFYDDVCYIGKYGEWILNEDKKLYPEDEDEEIWKTFNEYF